MLYILFGVLQIYVIIVVDVKNTLNYAEIYSELVEMCNHGKDRVN